MGGVSVRACECGRGRVKEKNEEGKKYVHINRHWDIRSFIDEETHILAK